MLSEIAQALLTQLQALGVFASVQGPQDSGEYPAAHVWLVKDIGVQDKPSVTRQLMWAVQVTSYSEQAPLAVLDLVDQVRGLFSGKLLSGHGHLEMTVPSIELAAYNQPGPTIYLVHIQMTVFPGTFTLT